MPQEVVGQADAYGLGEPERGPVPSAEKVADALKAPVPWERPQRVEDQ
jgi:hypothetical protein